MCVLYACVRYVCVCVCVCVYVYVIYVCVCLSKYICQRFMSGCFAQLGFHFTFLRQGLSLNVELTSSTTLVSELQVSSCLHPALRLQVCISASGFLHGCWGIQIQGFIYAVFHKAIPSSTDSPFISNFINLVLFSLGGRGGS